MDAVDPGKFAYDVDIDLEMCNTCFLAEDIADKLDGLSPNVEYTDGTNTNIPGTPFDVPFAGGTPPRKYKP